MRLLSLLSLAIVAFTGPIAATTEAGQDANPQVRAVLFYSPECPHCHDVMRDHLPPLFERYGDALRIVAVNVDTREGQTLYRAVAEHFQLPRARLGVPALVVGEQILVGAWEIPSQLPRLVETGLAGTGVDWPAIPQLRSYLSLQGIAAGPTVEIEGWMLAVGAAAVGAAAVEARARPGVGWRAPA